MTIQDFCIQKALPISTTSRRIRELVAEHVRAEHSGDEAAADAGFEHDLSEHGFRASKAEGRTRTTYDVYDPDLLFRTIFAKVKYDAVPDSDLDYLAGAAREFCDAALGESDWKLVQRKTGAQFRPNESYFDTLVRILRRVGR